VGHHLGGRVSHCFKLWTRLRLIRAFRLFILPDTPRWFIKEDRYEDAAKALGKLRRLPVDHPAVLEELNEVQANHLYEMSLGKASYIECCKGTLGKRLLTGCLLQALQQLTGVNFICKQTQRVYAFN
jgi:SP family sugar:H+ symporter-like MFS transporter